MSQPQKTYEQAISYIRTRIMRAALEVDYPKRPGASYATDTAIQLCAFVYGRDYETVKNDLIGGE